AGKFEITLSEQRAPKPASKSFSRRIGGVGGKLDHHLIRDVVALTGRGHPAAGTPERLAAARAIASAGFSDRLGGRLSRLPARQRAGPVRAPHAFAVVVLF